MNWPERVWIYSPVRTLFQKREISQWLQLVRPEYCDSALEIGCGLGRGARLLVERMGFRWIAAFDLEERLVKFAKKYMLPKFRGKISYFVSDAQDLPFPDKSFDAVINFGIIHHVIDWRRCIQEIGRVLKSRGIFYFEEIYPPLYANFLFKKILRHPTEDRFYAKEFLEAISANGMELVPGVKTNSRFGIIGAARKL